MIPLATRLLLLFPRRIEQNLERLRALHVVPQVPNLWQITLGVARMWHRVLFRFDSIGTSRASVVRPTLRARLLHPRPMRFPFLVWERAIAPLDFSGLVSTKERILRHLLAAHHDEGQFVYDLELLLLHEGGLEEARERAHDVVSGKDPRAQWLRDLTVFEGYHESLLDAVERAIQGDFGVDPRQVDDPDITFKAYLAWCARQPKTPEATWQALCEGRYSVATGIIEPSSTEAYEA